MSSKKRSLWCQRGWWLGTLPLCLAGSHSQADPLTTPALTAPKSVPATTRPAPPLVPMLPPHVFIDTDFGSPATPTQLQHSLRTGGNLAVPWRDTSGWGRVWVNYGVGSEGSQHFQRITVSKLEAGRGQCCYLLPNISGKTLKLNLKLRGTPGLSVFFGVRQQGFPLNYVWANVVVLTKQWRDLQWTFKLPYTAEPSLFIFEIPNNGQLDLASCHLEEPIFGYR